MPYYTYITTNPGQSTLYIGMTNNLSKRLMQHTKNRGSNKTFAGRYYCYKLIYYEVYRTDLEAIEREKELKKMTSGKERRTY